MGQKAKKKAYDRLYISNHGGVGMGDDFMDYMLLLDDDEEDEPKPGEKSGCGCLPSILGCLAVLAAIWFLCR